MSEFTAVKKCRFNNPNNIKIRGIKFYESFFATHNLKGKESPLKVIFMLAKLSAVLVCIESDSVLC